MTNESKRPAPLTKKHLARQERERREKRWVLIGVALVGVLVLGLFIYGIVKQNVLDPQQAVVVVNGDKVSTREFQAQTRLSRYFLVQNAIQTYNFASQFSDPQFSGQFTSQLQQFQSQLNPTVVGQQVLDYLVEDRLIRQEAEKRGITVAEEEIERSYKSWFNYFPDGTPTPTATEVIIPTSTLSPLQQSLVAPTATTQITATVAVTGTPAVELTPTTALEATATPDPNATATVTPFPTATATPYTEDGFKQIAATQLAEFKSAAGLSEADFRQAFVSQSYRQALLEQVTADVAATAPQVWARHILVADEAQAKDISSRLQAGEDFCKLAAENSTDTSNKDQCGDLGWFGTGAMVKEFEDGALALEVGAISQPVQTQFGFHIIQSLGKEDRPLTADELQQLKQTKFQEFLAALREAAQITINDDWVNRVPDAPSLPLEILQYIQQVSQPLPTDPGLIPTTPQP